MMPESRPAVQEMVGFAVDYTFFLNLLFVAVAVTLFWLHAKARGTSLASY